MQKHISLPCTKFHLGEGMAAYYMMQYGSRDLQKGHLNTFKNHTLKYNPFYHILYTIRGPTVLSKAVIKGHS